MSRLFVFVLGLAVGSFLNVCIARLPRHESVARPRSRCVHCGCPIRWYDNIPVLSYIMLRARCRDCGEHISAVYPLVEIMTAALFVTAWGEYGASLRFAKYAVFCALLLILIFTDLETRTLPHAVTVFGMAAGIAFSLLVPLDDRPVGWLIRESGISVEGRISSLIAAFAGALFGAGLFYGVGELFSRLRRKQALGFGDVMLMGMVGAFLGIPLTYITILIGSLLGTLVGGALYLASPRFRRDYQWPYGTFLSIAALYAGLGGGTLVQAYLHWGAAVR